jgi:hypothetical protein
MVRDPVAVMVSGYFQNLEMHFPGRVPAYQHVSVDELIRKFEEKVAFSTYPLTWFDREVKPVLGLDIHDHPFPKEAGAQVLPLGDMGELLILRSDLPDHEKEHHVNAFLGRDDIRLERHNVSDGKDYAAVYSEFKHCLRIPCEALDLHYTHRFTRHFWYDDEIAAMRARW